MSLLAIALAGLLLVAGPARAATDVYPPGGSTFSGSTEGWQVIAASCNVPVFCTATGGYDGAVGNPAGSLAANTNITLNPVNLFKSSVTFESPEFKVATAGAASVRADREFSQGSLVDLNPALNYSVRLIDKTAGTESKPIAETVSGTAGFKEVVQPDSVQAGHSYTLAVTAETGSAIIGTGLLAGNTSAHFDNVSLTVQSGDAGGAGGGAGGGGSSSLTSAQLQSLVNSGAAGIFGSATLKGKRLLVKARCPKKVGRACRVTLQGFLKKGKAATNRRVVKIARGKTKKVVLRLKPKARGKVAVRKRLLFKETVKAGSAKATAFKPLKLIRR